MNKINILGVNISLAKKKDAIKKIKSFLEDNKQHYIVTPNPEILLRSYSDEEYFYILNRADLALADGIGLFFAGLVMGKGVPRYTGADLLVDLLTIAEERGIKVGILNWRDGLSLSSEIEEFLKKNYPKLNFVIEEIDREWDMPYYRNINIFEPDIIFINTGAPYQEKFIHNNLKDLPYVKLAVGIGGAIDFLTGKIKRAPRIIRILGLEWTWRLLAQPDDRVNRLRRIFNATVIFPLTFIKWKFINAFKYRLNVACMLYKKTEDNYSFLMVERKDRAGYWQIPQGGTDGESIEVAGRRELMEEIGNNNFRSITAIKNVYKYKFNNDKAMAGIPLKYIHGYKGQKQGLFIAEYTGNDNDISINDWDHSTWQWVEKDNLVKIAHELRKESMKIFLQKFNEYAIENK